MAQREIARICIVYPADPLGVSPGGIDSFIRGILRWAPDDLKMAMVGVTTDLEKRPLNKWTTCYIGDRTFEFLPIVVFKNAERQAKVPLTLRYLAALVGAHKRIAADVLEFHRIEPYLAFLGDSRPKSIVLHQNMNVIRNRGSDIRWKYLPGLYFTLEKYVLARMQSVYCVREDAVQDYRRRFPHQADRFHFTPTWFDTETFQAPSEAERRAARTEIVTEYGLPVRSRIFIWVGRLDKQKNPQLLIDAFHCLHRSTPDVRLLIVGDGVLRRQVERWIEERGLKLEIVLCGVKPAADIARYLKAADVFVLPSAYEGMPICVLEALGSGVPVVATDVGEVSRVVKPGVNGELVADHRPEAVASAMRKCLNHVDEYRGAPSYKAAKDFTPARVLAAFYENYRNLVRTSAS